MRVELIHFKHPAPGEAPYYVAIKNSCQVIMAGCDDEVSARRVASTLAVAFDDTRNPAGKWEYKEI